MGGARSSKNISSSAFRVLQLQKVFYHHLHSSFVNASAGFYVSGLNLTEDAPYVLLHPLQNMKRMTMKALSLLLCWVSEQSPGSEVGGVNILCCDFVDISQFCSLVIGLNYKPRGSEKQLTSV